MMDKFSLDGKHILITGASSGIGRQCAVSCSEMGAVITLVARNRERLQDTLKHLYGYGHIIISKDLLDMNSIEEIVKFAVNKNGKIDGFIHAAGIEKTLPLIMHRPNIFEDIFTINTFSGFEFVRIITQKKYHNPYSCSIIFIASIMGVVGNGGLTGYSSSKGALIAGVKSLAIETSKKNIRINAISPGYISNTIMFNNKKESLSETAIQDIVKAHPLGLGDTEDVANACIFLLSDAAKWITGTNLIIDGGYSAK